MEYLINFATTGFDCGGADVLRVLRFIFILLDKLNIPFSLGKENEKHKMKDPKAGFSRPNEHFYDNVLR